MRILSLLFILLYSFTLIGYSAVSLAHTLAHQLSAIIPVHHHHHHHHHSLEDHHHVTKILSHAPDETPAGEQEILVNILSYLEALSTFTFSPHYLYTYDFGWQQQFVKDIFSEPTIPPPIV